MSKPQPSRALAQAREWALERAGAVLATGSVYLVGELLSALDGEDAPEPNPPGGARQMSDQGPRCSR